MIKTNPPAATNTGAPTLSRPSMRRRRQSKGLIAATPPPPSSSDTLLKNDTNHVSRSASSSSAAAAVSIHTSAILPVPLQGNRTGGLPKPCYSARIALACVQNALREEDVVASCQGVVGEEAARIDRGGGKYDAMEEEFLTSPPECGPDLEEYSSGDDDEYDNEAGLGSGKSVKEPFFVPTGPEAASMGLQGGQVAGGAGRLPFNYRKLKYFDYVNASDRAVVRAFLRQEIANAKKIRMKVLADHLRSLQSKERERIRSGKEDSGIDDVGHCDVVDLNAEQHALATALERFPHELTPTMSAALLIECLAMNHNESIEGMAKCYDGIVSAGTALLDLQNEGGSRDSKQKLTTAEIIAALEPLLITTLEQPSGETIVALAQLRNFCGTKRYQRRFVQRIAPFLVRPADAAIWCLRHQNDIGPIIAAVEMILDHALEIFSPGWYERGRNLLNDSQRVEKLRSAASQLRRLNSPSPSDGILSGLSTGGSSIHRRGQYLMSAGARRDNQIGNESLAEWEIITIDKHIRQSILDVFSRDWSRISALNLSPKEGEATSYGSRRRSGISAAKSKSTDWQHDAAVSMSGTSSVSMSAKNPRAKIPLSPRNSLGPLSGPSVGSAQVPSADALESAFGPSFSSQNIDDDNFSDRPRSPTNFTNAAPSSPTRDVSKLATPKTPPPPHEIRNVQATFGEYVSSPGSSSRMGIAPLSPQSSVGNASTSSAGAMSLRTLSGGQMGNKDQYRALTATAAERKRTVAACRALRAQITKFEESFIQMHGRAPKGAAERAPLASTYMQYREWKRAIRADAACRIQALIRGAYVRSIMLRSPDPRMSRLVSLRHSRLYKAESTRTDHLSHLSIPLDIGGTDQVQSSIVEQNAHRGVDTRSRLEARASPRSDDGVEVVMRPNTTSTGATSTSTSSNWKSRQQSTNQSGGGSPGSHTQRATPGKSRSSLPDVTMMSLPELQQRKRELKQQLKMYDLNFHAQHGRMPEKREKEPIRHLYESYNAYKNQISVIEKGEAQPGPGTEAFRGREDAVAAGLAPESSLPDRLSPSGYLHEDSSQTNESSNSPKIALEIDNSDDSQAAKTNTDDVVLSQDLSALKAEKATLHQMLRSYEKDFFKQHKRQVSSFGDIRPVAGQYRRYKEIKKAIASLQDK
eukprot:CCRYP_003545-RA/>CCRYP_003545-RA protein AED:0.06 eAED:0.06 QI:0/0/0/1/1/1/2/0/1149